MSIRKRLPFSALVVTSLGWAFACSSPGTDGPASGSGGNSVSPGATGGTPGATGGIPSTSGGVSATGGNVGATGGAPAATGGAPSSGGSPSTTGGVTTIGGAATGGAATGGAATGGQATSGGGSNATGGGGTSGKGGASTGGAAAGSSSGGKASGGAGGAATGGAATGGSGGGASDLLTKFSFFVVSYPAIISLSGKTEGFGGDLRFGKADGLSGADEICRQAAEKGFPGAGQKTWRAFLSVTQGPGGAAVNARDRIGSGPWYDRKGRLFATNLDGLFAGDRPAGDAVVVNDFPNENGDPNHYVGPNGLSTAMVDDHDTLTGSDTMGRLMATSAAQTCNDWTSTTVQGTPRIGHSWPRSASSGRSWVSDHTVPGCVAGVDRTLGGTGSGSCIGCSGGYGGFYCFALP